MILYDMVDFHIKMHVKILAQENILEGITVETEGKLLYNALLSRTT